ncbi:MAG: 30S ribosomal protein S6 [Bacillales bacterium]|nr:30S ribosomal protein S6 [Bacillales bacterium]
MNKYEAMYIIRPDVNEEDRKALIAEISAIFTSRGTSEVKVNEWGLRKLAYEIDECKEGYYVVLSFESESPEALNEYDRVSNIRDAIIRHIVVKLPK